MTLTHWLSLFTVCLLGAISPGPSLAVVLGNTLRQGRGAGLAAALAHGAGVGLYGLITVSGLAVVMTSSPRLFGGLQILGACYLVYLGLRGLLAGAAPPAAGDETGAPAPRRGSSATAGFLVAFLNPKLAIFMLALFSQFLGPDNHWGAKTVMVLTVGLTDAAWYSLVAVLASRPGALAWLRYRGVLIERLLAVVLIVLGSLVLLRALAALAG
ncbi:LysE family translocator [Parahaliea aestuarii]|uniref:LysE family translocator n=1 Tax=Parahaliea aestuarii TaxID=1852021 RepID=A0A5C9A0E1_9GAMM|nr:LysE family translocator [Parahaliea aestuarii]TXS93352.1 LysE family translocator [Parahaliea aestuarii]